MSIIADFVEYVKSFIDDVNAIDAKIKQIDPSSVGTDLMEYSKSFLDDINRIDAKIKQIDPSSIDMITEFMIHRNGEYADTELEYKITYESLMSYITTQ